METEIVFGCSHIPFHNKKLLNGVLKLIEDIKPTGVSLIGDIFDMNAFSFHDRGQIPLMDIKTEYKMSEKYIQDIFLATRKVKHKRFLYGNHEDRYLRHLKVPDSKRIIIEPVEERFRFAENGWQVKTDWKEDYYTLGEYLDIFHGELLGEHPAKRQLDKTKKSCMFVHSHRMQTYVDGKMASFNIGGLFDKDSIAFKYAGRLTRSRWANGFAVVYIDNNGYYYVHPISCYNDTFIFNGKKY